MNPPASIPETQTLIERTIERFARSEDFMYTIFDSSDTEIYGGAGIHRRSEPGYLEIGYWVRVDQTQNGYATEAVRALTRVALQIPGTTRVQIDSDPRNLHSIRVPKKLGYRYLELRKGNKLTPTGQPRDTAVFEIAAAERLGD